MLRRINSFSSAWEPDPWPIACKTMTNIETFYALFGSMGGRLDDEEIQEYVEARKEEFRLTQEDTPKNVPKSHWWWFANFNIET